MAEDRGAGEAIRAATGGGVSMKSDRIKRARVSNHLLLQFFDGRCDLENVEAVADRIPADASIVSVRLRFPREVEYVIRSETFDLVEYDDLSEVPEMNLMFRRSAG